MSVVPASSTWAMFGWSIMRQRLPLGLEAGDDLALSMPGLMILSATLAPDRLGLLGHVDDAHAPLADLLEQLVRADDRAGAFGDHFVIVGRIQNRGAALQETIGRFMRLEQAFDPLA